MWKGGGQEARRVESSKLDEEEGSGKGRRSEVRRKKRWRQGTRARCKQSSEEESSDREEKREKSKAGVLCGSQEKDKMERETEAWTESKAEVFCQERKDRMGQ